MQNKKIIIVGGGFGGISAARALARKNLKQTDIILISDKTYFEYYPALYRLVTSASPIEACVPLSEMLPENVEIVHDKINLIDPMGKKITSEGGNKYEYDELILALGSQTTYFNLPGLDTLSFGFKSVAEALRLKEHICKLFEMHAHPTKEEMVSHFHIVIVGGGPSGVEVAGDLVAHMKRLAKETKTDPSFITIDIIEAGSRLVPALPEDVSAKILARIRKLGINVFLNRTLVKEEITSVFMNDMSLESKTVIWTAGTMLSSLYKDIPGISFTERKKVEVTEFLEAKNLQNIYIIGDAAGTPYSGLAQTAIYDGKEVARIIAKKLSIQQSQDYKNEVQPYKPKPNAYSIPVGDDWGVLVIGSFRLYGILAYLIRHAIDFIYFAKIVSPKQLFGMYFEGYKYRRKK